MKRKGIDVSLVTQLANLDLTQKEKKVFVPQLAAILEFISSLEQIPTDKVPETSQVTGLTNVMRDDDVDSSRMFTQEEALANATKSYNGYFLVRYVLSNE